MATSKLGPLGGVVRGVIAGAAGTLAMDLLWYSRYRRSGGETSFRSWELATSTTFDDAPPPAQVGQLLVKNLFSTDLPDTAAPATTNLVHWGTGVQWGALYGLAAASLPARKGTLGLLLGPVAWGTSYAVLGAAKLYGPIWDYDAKTLARDLTAHLVFGLTAASVFRVLSR